MYLRVNLKNVNTKLSNESGDLNQYQRRACILVDGNDLREEENEDQIVEKVKNVLTHNLGFDEEEI